MGVGNDLSKNTKGAPTLEKSQPFHCRFIAEMVGAVGIEPTTDLRHWPFSVGHCGGFCVISAGLFRTKSLSHRLTL
jgi:hypothetical protein